jgi:hypothetical protein
MAFENYNTDILKGRHQAQEIAQLMTAAYWSTVKDGHRNFLVKQVHVEFAKLAEALGYRVEKITEEADKPAEPVVITEREVYTSDMADAFTLGFSQRESL